MKISEHFSPKDSFSSLCRQFSSIYKDRRVRALSGGNFDDETMTQIQGYLTKIRSLRGLPEAINGKSSVYLPTDFSSYVIKKPSAVQMSPSKRLKKINMARWVCDEINATHLTIPKAVAIYHPKLGELLVETRLPIKSDMTNNYALYHENREKFAQTAVEFFTFNMLTNTDERTKRGVFANITNAYPVRFDNFSFYLEDGIGKMALIDLEHYSENQDATYSLKKTRENVEKAIGYFPYHFDEIMKKAIELCPEIRTEMESLKDYHKNALSQIHLCYEKPLQYLEKQQITVDNPWKPLRFSLKTKELLEEALNEHFFFMRETFKERADYYYESKHSERNISLQMFKDNLIAKKIIVHLEMQLNTLLDKQKKRGSKIETKADLINARRKNYNKLLLKEICGNTELLKRELNGIIRKPKETCSPFDARARMIEHLIYHALEKLTEQKELVFLENMKGLYSISL